MNNTLPQFVVLDTCVLISNVLRHVLLRLAERSVFRVAWSPVIGDEWCRTAGRLWAVPSEDIHAQWDAMQNAFPEASQGDVSAYKTGLKYSDPKDWHVIATARAIQHRHTACSVGVLTRNIKDFNRSELRRLGIQRWAPDAFLTLCFMQHDKLVLEALFQLLGEEKTARRYDEPLALMLKRERLFCLNRLVAVAAENTQ
ncbi:MAG: PIN domain-containing protein [Pusillimonas sp.]|nr:PIN domain-containing protein [Pusillimonas sp.]